MGLDCTVVVKENADVVLSRISVTMSVNYVALLMCAVLVFAAGLVTYVMVRLGVSTMQTYYNLLGPALPLPATGIPASQVANDNVVYADDTATTGPDADPALASNLQSSDNNRILASMNLLKGKYAQYNASMTEYAARVKNRVPDDLMDESILSRGNDDFSYTSTSVKN